MFILHLCEVVFSTDPIGKTRTRTQDLLLSNPSVDHSITTSHEADLFKLIRDKLARRCLVGQTLTLILGCGLDEWSSPLNSDKATQKVISVRSQWQIDLLPLSLNFCQKTKETYPILKRRECFVCYDFRDNGDGWSSCS